MTVGGKFVVNDTPWFEYPKKTWPKTGIINKKVTLAARVTNTAEYISQTFEDFLKQHRGWNRQQVLEGQKIDAYIEVEHPAGYTTNKTALFSFLDQYTTENPDPQPDTATVRLYQMYVERSLFDIAPLDSKYHSHFTKATATGKLRVGLEFETGNIASSFRALSKLGFLYRRGKIDAGVFITSIDKANAAARIWPSAS